MIPASWKQVKVKDIAIVTSGGTPDRNVDHYWNGDIPWITTSLIDFNTIESAYEYITKEGFSNSSAKLFPKGTILMAMYGQGVTRGKVALLGIEATTNQACAAIKVDEKTNNVFLFYYLASKYKELRYSAHGSHQDNLSGGLILNFDVLLPPLHEQQKIAEILSVWDKAIEKSESLIAVLHQRKKGLTQRLLTGQVRFQGFKEKWKTVHLRDVFQRVLRKAGDKKVNCVLSITATVGFVDQREKFGKVIAGKNLANYTLLQKGEFAYNKGNSNSYPQGCIYLLEEFEEGAVPNVYFSFAKKSINDVNAHFYKHYFESGALNPQLEKYISSSVRGDGLFNIAFDDFFNVKIPLPPIEEQNKIAAVLDTCDNEIKLQIKKLEALKKQKKGLMQKLLSGQIRVKV